MVEPAAPGRVADRYSPRRLLGAGATADVWLAADAVTGRDVALKLLRPAAVAANPALAGSLAAAGATAKRLTHPAIVRVLDAGEAGPHEFLAMDLVVGGTLAQLRGAPWRDIVAAVTQVAEAVQFAHAVGVIHRDLKAGNVLRDERGRCFVTDFGGSAAGSLSSLGPGQLTGAPPAIADDLYGLGALLFDLLAGAPPFHPDITAERIAGEVPPRLAVDGSGATLPPALTSLVAALLEKDPARRPAGMGAARAALEELLAGGRSLPAPPAPDVAVRSRTAPAKRSRPGFVYAGLVVLAAVAAAVVVVLPGVVRERGPLVPVPATLPGAAAPGAPAVPAPDRAAADTARSAYLAEVDAANQAGLSRFRPGALSAAAATVATADSDYQARRFGDAARGYVTATRSLAELRAAIPGLLAAALKAGDEALAAGDAGRAATAYGEALAIAPGDTAGMRGATRAAALPAVLAAMADGSARENAGDLPGARAAYARARALDGDWQPAAAALERLAAGAAASGYQQAMAAGLAAAAAGRDADARSAYGRALATRPGDAAALSGIAELDRRATTRDLTALAAEASAASAAESWTEAVARYGALLKADPTLAAAQAGLAEAELRAALEQRLRTTLAATDTLNDAGRARAAAALLADARSVTAPGPRLRSQMDSLAAALDAASRAVPVVFESDNLTRVTIFKVGELGSFAARTVPLKPGAYTVVGRRDGYRDVRRQIRVAADGSLPPVVVRCEEPI